MNSRDKPDSPNSLLLREKLRESFLPLRVVILFVGESPPASGRFFYAADSGLYRAMRMAFHCVDSRLADDDFLAAFRASGCYLTDLCREPVDQFDAPLRRQMRREGEAFLAGEIERLRPVMLAPVLQSIRHNVLRAAERAKWQGEVLKLPYPGRWVRHRDAFIEALVPVLRRLKLDIQSPKF